MKNRRSARSVPRVIRLSYIHKKKVSDAPIATMTSIPHLSDRANNKDENDDDDDDDGTDDKHGDDRDGVCAWVPICHDWRVLICPCVCGCVLICCVVFLCGSVLICISGGVRAVGRPGRRAGGHAGKGAVGARFGCVSTSVPSSRTPVIC